MSYLTTFGYLLGITGIGSIVLGLNAPQNSGVLIGSGAMTLVCGVIMWAAGRYYQR